MRLSHGRCWLLSLLVTPVLAGAETVPERWEDSLVWVNPQLPDDEAQRQFPLDDRLCGQVSDGAVPMPAPRMYRPRDPSYVIDGQATTTSPQSLDTTTTQFRATVRSQRNPFDEFSKAYEEGRQQVRAQQDAEAQRRSVFLQCMGGFGWRQMTAGALRAADEAAQVAEAQRSEEGCSVVHHRPSREVVDAFFASKAAKLDARAPGWRTFYQTQAFADYLSARAIDGRPTNEDRFGRAVCQGNLLPVLELLKAYLGAPRP